MDGENAPPDEFIYSFIYIYFFFVRCLVSTMELSRLNPCACCSTQMNTGSCKDLKLSVNNATDDRILSSSSFKNLFIYFSACHCLLSHTLAVSH